MSILIHAIRGLLMAKADDKGGGGGAKDAGKGPAPTDAPKESAAPGVAGEAPPPESGAAEEDDLPELAKKISIKTVVGSVINERRPAYDEATGKGEEFALMRVWGMARGIRRGSSTYGDWLSFKGDFEAINLQTGVVKRGVECFLPEPVQTEMWGRLIETQKADPGASIQFAFDIWVRGTKGTVGYEYFVKAVMKATGADPLAALRNSVKALPMPSKVVPPKKGAAAAGTSVATS